MSQEVFIQELFDRSYQSRPGFPDKDLAAGFADQLFAFLFTPYRDRHSGKESLQEEFDNLKNTFSALLYDLVHNKWEVKGLTDVFFDAIPSIYHRLLKDAATIVQFDPAAESIEEVLVAYPGFYATAIHRIAHQLYRQKIATLPRILSEHAHSKTGVDIHPAAQIGTSFFIDHGTGIVIGESTIIGDNVKIYQGVTIGALNVSKEYAKLKRHPTIGDDVVIYSGATILGGETVIGHHSIIGGNVWLTSSVEPYSVVYHKSEVIIRDKNPLPEPLNFII